MKERFTITLEPLPSRPGGPSASQRMRQLLRIALRRQRLRCVDIRQHEQLDDWKKSIQIKRGGPSLPATPGGADSSTVPSLQATKRRRA